MSKKRTPTKRQKPRKTVPKSECWPAYYAHDDIGYLWAREAIRYGNAEILALYLWQADEIDPRVRRELAEMRHAASIVAMLAATMDRRAALSARTMSAVRRQCPNTHPGSSARIRSTSIKESPRCLSSILRARWHRCRVSVLTAATAACVACPGWAPMALIVASSFGVSPPFIGTGVRLVFWDTLVAVVMGTPPAKRVLVFSLRTRGDWWRRCLCADVHLLSVGANDRPTGSSDCSSKSRGQPQPWIRCRKYCARFALQEACL